MSVGRAIKNEHNLEKVLRALSTCPENTELTIKTTPCLLGTVFGRPEETGSRQQGIFDCLTVDDIIRITIRQSFAQRYGAAVSKLRTTFTKWTAIASESQQESP